MRDYREWGCAFRDGWYLDDEGLNPTRDHTQTNGNTGFRLHFNHLIRNPESFSEGHAHLSLADTNERRSPR